MSGANTAGTVGFVGLGAMGLPMALNLLKAGYSVQGFDLNPAALAALGQAGGIGAASAAEAATGADALVLMVVNAAQAETVLFDAGAAEALPKGGSVVVMATCPPQAVAALAERVEAMGRRLIDAPNVVLVEERYGEENDFFFDVRLSFVEAFTKQLTERRLGFELVGT